MGYADLHIHSIYSYDGTSSIPAILKHVIDHTDLNVIAITDHDTTDGVHEAMDLAPAYGIEVIPGCEISTAEGHLLGLFIDQPVKAGQSLVDTVLQVRQLGGLCAAAHPMARGLSSLRIEAIRKALGTHGVAGTLVGVEAFNGGLVYTRRNPLVAALCQTLPLAQLGNSDSHILQTIGQGSTYFHGKSAADLRAALIAGATRVRRHQVLNGFNVLASYIPLYLLRVLGWAVWNENPRAPLTYARLSRAMGGRPS